MQAEEYNQYPSRYPDGFLPCKNDFAYPAGRCPHESERKGETENEKESRYHGPAAPGIFPEVLCRDAGNAGKVYGNKRKYARAEERDDTERKACEYPVILNIFHFVE